MSDPISDALKNLDAFRNNLQGQFDKEYPVHRDNLRKLIPGVPIPDRIIIPPLGGKNQDASSLSIPRAEQFLACCVNGTRGKKYTWGGDTFNTFDCSAVVVKGARDIGIKVPRVTYDQFTTGQEIRWGQQQIGDLLFSRFSSPSTPEHVSIWAGNGKVYEAGDPVDFYNWGDRGTVRVRRIV